MKQPPPLNGAIPKTQTATLSGKNGNSGTRKVEKTSVKSLSVYKVVTAVHLWISELDLALNSFSPSSPYILTNHWFELIIDHIRVSHTLFFSECSESSSDH
jgi:hypothetical protein